MEVARLQLGAVRDTMEERLVVKQQQLEARKKLVDEQAAVIEKLKLPLLDMTSALQELQVRARERLSCCYQRNYPHVYDKCSKFWQQEYC